MSVWTGRPDADVASIKYGRVVVGAAGGGEVTGYVGGSSTGMGVGDIGAISGLGRGGVSARGGDVKYFLGVPGSGSGSNG